MMNKLYWKTRDGKVLDVDLMNEAHVRNAFKMVLSANPILQASKEDVQQVKDKFLSNLIPDSIFGYDSPFNKVTKSYCSLEDGKFYCSNKGMNE